MNYIGSKLSLLEFLENSINKVVDKKNCQVFCDLFAGTGIVGNYFKKKGYKIIANDIQYYSYVLNKHYIENHKELKFLKLTKKLSELKKAGRIRSLDKKSKKILKNTPKSKGVFVFSLWRKANSYLLCACSLTAVS